MVKQGKHFTNSSELSLRGYKVTKKQHHYTHANKTLCSAIDIYTNEKVTVLLYHSNSWEAREHLRRESTALSTLAHPLLPRLREIVPYSNEMTLVVMDYIEGELLSKVSQFRKLSFAEFKQLVESLLQAQIYLHEQVNLGHGNLTPDHILVRSTPKGLKVTVIGFELSRLDGTAVESPLSVSGTPGFLPRSQSCNPNPKATADLYSLGITLLCVWYQTPVARAARAFGDAKTGHVDVPLTAFGLQWYLAQFVRRLVSPQPYQSARSALADLGKLERRWQKTPMRCLVAGGVAGLISAFGWTAAFQYQSHQIARQKEAGEYLIAVANSKYAEAARRVRQRREEEEARRRALEARRQREEEEARQEAYRQLILANISTLTHTLQCPGCDLSGAVLSSLDLSGANLRDATLVGASFIAADLEGADLSRADLTQAVLDDANLTRTNFFEATLIDAEIVDAFAQEACFKAADLTDATLAGTDLTNASFERSNTELTWFGWRFRRTGALGPTGEVWSGETTAPPACP